jgi:hypothetical protein
MYKLSFWPRKNQLSRLCARELLLLNIIILFDFWKIVRSNALRWQHERSVIVWKLFTSALRVKLVVILIWQWWHLSFGRAAIWQRFCKTNFAKCCVLRTTALNRILFVIVSPKSFERSASSSTIIHHYSMQADVGQVNVRGGLFWSSIAKRQDPKMDMSGFFKNWFPFPWWSGIVRFYMQWKRFSTLSFNNN